MIFLLSNSNSGKYDIKNPAGPGSSNMLNAHSAKNTKHSKQQPLTGPFCKQIRSRQGAARVLNIRTLFVYFKQYVMYCFKKCESA